MKKCHNIPQWLDKRNIPKSLNIAGQSNMKESLSLRPLKERIGASCLVVAIQCIARPAPRISTVHRSFAAAAKLVVQDKNDQRRKLIVRCTFSITLPLSFEQESPS